MTEGTTKRWLVLYSRIPTNFNPQNKLVIEAETIADARAVARDHLGDSGKQLPTYSIDAVSEYKPEPVRGRVVPASELHAGRRPRVARVDEPQTIGEAVRRTSEVITATEGARSVTVVSESEFYDRPTDEIFERVMAAMQPAEEISGPSAAQYVALMERIAHEAQRRADRVREEDREPTPGHLGLKTAGQLRSKS